MAVLIEKIERKHRMAFARQSMADGLTRAADSTKGY
tara:strand:- start:445 stop:552 length:108 start_codon:yes stop_codon:yes gene_type:complete